MSALRRWELPIRSFFEITHLKADVQNDFEKVVGFLYRDVASLAEEIRQTHIGNILPHE